MSCFVHTNRELNNLGKYLKEEIKMNEQLADSVILNLYHFELISFNGRYDEKENINFKFSKGEEYDQLDNLTDYDALKLLDSIKYQSDYIQSPELFGKMENLHKKLTNGIVEYKELPKNYKKQAEYEASLCW
ncbi:MULTISPECIES: hypothetical protein [Staphylococcus]|uniref:hypothetical protein n=1 Tax=Staphylococcus TaxID=1279 RepID=UPI0008A47A89|nr:MULTISPECIES: hypothetical protein [Staphylococcus]MDS3838294.1 hypothetical protein [Staphylococcus hominis]OFS53490.1 hypothetical protein HMPREF2862_09910 [Staphylococcus sp. HMSC065C09]OHQ09740.1 hypothetical protein HMPREF2664_10570 [Staphylococcus sp. HMSC064E03]